MNIRTAGISENLGGQSVIRNFDRTCFACNLAKILGAIPAPIVPECTGYVFLLHTVITGVKSERPIFDQTDIHLS